MTSKIFRFQRSVYSRLEIPVYRRLFNMVGMVLLLGGLTGGYALWRMEINERAFIKFIGTWQYWAFIAWMVLVMAWYWVRKLWQDEKNLIQMLQVRWESIHPEQLGFDPKIWEKGYHAYIDGEFTRWGFTEAEKEVGSLILAGMSQEKIAGVRKTSLKTVKNQTTVLYEKAQVKNGRELSAHFLQLLLSGSDSPSKQKGSSPR